MENIYKAAVQAAKDGARFTVNLEERTLTINGKKWIDGGEYEGELGMVQCTTDLALTKIYMLYKDYKHSVPSERSENKSRHYFKALKEHELSDRDMMYGMPRDEAQIRLELYVLCSILNGSFVWPDDNLWFWQSQLDKDLIILKDWIK